MKNHRDDAMVFFPRLNFPHRLSPATLLHADDAVGDLQSLSREADSRENPEPEPQPNPSDNDDNDDDDDINDTLGVKLNLTWVDLAGRLRPVWWVDAHWWLDAAGDDPGWPIPPRTRNRARTRAGTRAGSQQRFGKSWQ